MWVSAPQEDGCFLNTRVEEPGLSEVTQLCLPGQEGHKTTPDPGHVSQAGLEAAQSPVPSWGGEGNNLPLCLRSICNALPWEVSAGECSWGRAASVPKPLREELLSRPGVSRAILAPSPLPGLWLSLCHGLSQAVLPAAAPATRPSRFICTASCSV